MKIGIDIDEVIVGYVEGYIKLYNELKGTDFKFGDWHSYNFWEVFGGTKEEAIEIADKYYQSDYFENVGLIEGAKEALEELSKKNEIFIITSRPDKLIDHTKRFFNKHFLDFNFDIIHTGDFFKNQGKPKSQICEEKCVEVMIEDNLNYAIEIAEKGMNVLLFDKPWNQKELLPENIFRVYSWNEALNKVKEIKNAKIF